MRSPTDRCQPQKSDLRRSAILESLDNHLRESGFDGLNIADVTRRAGVTRSAFYFYFENKAAAVAALLEPMYDDGFIASDILTDTARPPRLRIRAMLEALLDTVDQHRYLLQAMLESRDRLLERYTIGGRLTRESCWPAPKQSAWEQFTPTTAHS